MARTDERAERRERMRQRAASRQSEGGSSREYLALPKGVKIWAPDQKKHLNKKTKLDFLLYPVSVDGHPDGIPVAEGAASLWARRPYLVHRDVGPEKHSVVCPKSFAQWPTGDVKVGTARWLKLIDAPCPICEEHILLSADEDNWKDEKKKAVMSALKPSVRELYNILPLDDAEPTVGVFDYTWHWFGSALDQKLQEGDDAILDFAEFKGGMTMNVTWRPTDLKNRDGDSFLETNPDAISFSDRGDYDQKEWAGEVIDLDAVLVRKTYKELEAMFQGVDAEPENEPEASSTRKRRAAVPPTKEPEPENEPEKDDIPTGCSVCVACEGTKKTSRGNDCRICGGKGYTPDASEPEDEDEPEVEEDEPEAEEQEQPTRRRRGAVTGTEQPPAQEAPSQNRPVRRRRGA